MLCLKGLNYTMHRIEGLKDFNKPILLNEGIKRTTGEYILCTDADYIFRSDFSECLLNNIKENTNTGLCNGNLNSESKCSKK